MRESMRTAAVRRIGLVCIALACVAVVTACGSSAQPASTRPATGGGAVSQRAASAHPAGSPAATVYAKHVDFLNGVSCAAPANCTAVGNYYLTTSGPQLTLIERWDGSAWRVERSPTAGLDGTLDSVSCPSASSCTAVGSLVLGWNGTSWKVELASSPFSSVSCAAPDSCMAVGVTSGGQPEYGYWDGTSWSLGPMPEPPHPAQSITLAAVACSGPSFCLAVGDYTYGVGAMPSPTSRDKTLAERWNGSTWTVIRSVNVAHWNQLSAVSCTSPRACTAVGSSASEQFALAERWDGSTWAVQRVPDVSAYGYTRLTAVSCSTDSTCMATGTYDGGSAAIAESWNGTAWTLHTMPGPPQSQPYLQPTGLSCTGPAACVAVGADGSTLTEIWDDTHWQITPAPNP